MINRFSFSNLYKKEKIHARQKNFMRGKRPRAVVDSSFINSEERTDIYATPDMEQVMSWRVVAEFCKVFSIPCQTFLLFEIE